MVELEWGARCVMVTRFDPRKNASQITLISVHLAEIEDDCVDSGDGEWYATLGHGVDVLEWLIASGSSTVISSW